MGKQTEAIKTFKLNDYPRGGYRCEIKPPLYIHGTLTDGEMIIGVNDSSQIKNKELSENEEIQSCFIKQKLLEDAGQLKETKFRNIINNSLIICTYGLSLGSTDSIYWEIIKDRLVKSDAIFIISIYDGDLQKYSDIYSSNKQSRIIKESFYINSKATKEEKDKINNRIIVEVNHPLFTNMK